MKIAVVAYSVWLACLVPTVAQEKNLTTAATSNASLEISTLKSREDRWLGFKRYIFEVDGCDCWLVAPQTPLPENHWVWCMKFPDAFPKETGAPALLAKGYYYAFMEVGDTFGSPSARAHLDAFYKTMTGVSMCKSPARQSRPEAPSALSWIPPTPRPFIGLIA